MGDEAEGGKPPGNIPMLLWLDFETTGLDKEQDLLMEVAVLLTPDTPHYMELDSFTTAIEDFGSRPEEQHAWLTRLQRPQNEVALDMHLKTGLVEELVKGHGVGVSFAEDQILAMLGRFIRDDEKVTLAGAGVSHFDHELIVRRMPRLAERLHYWDFDVSVARKVLERVSPLIVDCVQARLDAESERTAMPAHRAMPDVLNAIRWANALAGLEPRVTSRSG